MKIVETDNKKISLKMIVISLSLMLLTIIVFKKGYLTYYREAIYGICIPAIIILASLAIIGFIVSFPPSRIKVACILTVVILAVITTPIMRHEKIGVFTYKALTYSATKEYFTGGYKLEVKILGYTVFTDNIKDDGYYRSMY